MSTYNTAVMSWTEIVKNANSLKARLDGQKARMPFGRRPYIYGQLGVVCVVK
jgi:hypothetical protein